MPVFGQRLAGKLYMRRPGAYAVILDADRRVAVVHTPQGYFLPGGACNEDEAPEAALRREVVEECGHAIDISHKIGEAVEYLYARSDGRHYQIHSTFFQAALRARVGDAVERHYSLEWLDALSAIDRLQRQSQAWAVLQVIGPQR